MKSVLTVALLFGVAALSTLQGQTEQEHETLMKSAGSMLGPLRKAVGAQEGPTVAEAGRKIEGIFAEVEKFWAGRNTADAAGWSRDAQMAAREMVSAGESGRNPAEAFARLSEACRVCHETHRTKADDGSWRIK
jgi:cytochrome c556